MKADLKAYFAAIQERGLTLVFGTAASFILCLLSRAGLPDVVTAPAWTLASGVFASFMIASFQAWRELRRDLGKLNVQLRSLSKPKFSLQFLRVHTIWMDKTSVMLIVEASVINEGAPSFCSGYHMTMRTDGAAQRTFDQILLPDEGFHIDAPGHPRITFTPADQLPTKTAGVPIATGARVFGVLCYGIKGVTKEIMENPSIELSVEIVGVGPTPSVWRFLNPREDADGYGTRVPGMSYGRSP